jgi:hypothetical protein
MTCLKRKTYRQMPHGHLVDVVCSKDEEIAALDMQLIATRGDLKKLQQILEDIAGGENL